MYSYRNHTNIININPIMYAKVSRYSIPTLISKVFSDLGCCHVKYTGDELLYYCKPFIRKKTKIWYAESGINIRDFLTLLYFLRKGGVDIRVLNFMEVIRECKPIYDNSLPCIIHCKAKVGRIIFDYLYFTNMLVWENEV